MEIVCDLYGLWGDCKEIECDAYELCEGLYEMYTWRRALFKSGYCSYECGE